MRRLSLEGSERVELGRGVDHRLDGRRPEGSDQLVLEVVGAHEEPVTVEGPLVDPCFGGVAQAEHIDPASGPFRHRAPDVGSAPDVDHGDPDRVEVMVEPARQRRDRCHVALPLDQDDTSDRLEPDHPVECDSRVVDSGGIARDR